MKLCLLLVLAALMFAPLAYGQGGTVSQTMRLHHIVAQEIPTTLKSASALNQLTIGFQDNSVTASGSQEAVAAFEKELHAADVEPIQYLLRMHLVGYHVDKHGKYVENWPAAMVPSFDINTTNKVEAWVAVMAPGYKVLVTPEGNADGTVNLTAEVQEIGEQGEIVSDGKNTLTVPLGKTVRITGMTDATDKPLRRAVQQGQIVLDHGEYTGWYLDVTPTLRRP